MARCNAQSDSAEMAGGSNFESGDRGLAMNVSDGVMGAAAGLRRAGLAAAVCAAMASGYALPAWAGATPPQQPAGAERVDLSNASTDEIRTHILDACVVQQWSVASSPKDSYADKCGCYARRVMQALSDDELAAFRRSAVFSNTARPKAQDAKSACNL